MVSQFLSAALAQLHWQLCGSWRFPFYSSGQLAIQLFSKHNHGGVALAWGHCTVLGKNHLMTPPQGTQSPFYSLSLSAPPSSPAFSSWMPYSPGKRQGREKRGRREEERGRQVGARLLLSSQSEVVLVPGLEPRLQALQGVTTVCSLCPLKPQQESELPLSPPKDRRASEKHLYSRIT